MKPAEPWTDAEIDAALRDVAVPASLAERLRPEALFDDSVIDRILGAVPVPGGLATRLRVTGNSTLVPPREQPTVAPARLRRTRQWLRAAVRDGLAVALSLGVVATMFIAGLRIAEWAQGPGGSRPRGAPAGTTRSIAAGTGRPAAKPDGRDRLAIDEADQPAEDGGVAPPSYPAVSDATTGRSRPPALRAAPVPVSDGAGSMVGSRAGGPFLGMRVVPDERAGDSSAVRRSVPGMRGFDLAFEMAHGEAPFVDPSIVPELAVDRPPLVVATDSFDRVWPLPAGRRRRAELEGLRVEHLLAALSARGAEAGGDVATVGLSAVRSWRPGRPTYLVEVRVDVPIATEAAAASALPTDATLVLDHSAAPGAVPLWLSACRGLAAAAARMSASDRLTVVVAEPRPRVVAIRGAADDIRRLAAELEGEIPFGIADLDAAVTLAREVTAREGVPERLVVVAHAERAEHCVGVGREALNRWRAAVSRDEASETVTSFLLVSGVPDGGPAALAGMPGWTLSDPTALRRRLADVLVSRPGVVLESAAVEVRFDPAAIAAYRLVGHRQSVPESLSAFGRPAVDSGVAIHEGETVRAVYEVVPRQPPRGRLDGISATFTSREPAGTVRTVTAHAAPLDPAVGGLPSAAGCELLLAVAVGEFPGRSVHAVPKAAVVEGVRGIMASWERRGDETDLGRRLLAVFDDLAAGSGASAGR